MQFVTDFNYWLWLSKNKIVSLTIQRYRNGLKISVNLGLMSGYAWKKYIYLNYDQPVKSDINNYVFLESNLLQDTSDWICFSFILKHFVYKFPSKNKAQRREYVLQSTGLFSVSYTTLLYCTEYTVHSPERNTFNQQVIYFLGKDLESFPKCFEVNYWIVKWFNQLCMDVSPQSK